MRPGGICPRSAVAVIVCVEDRRTIGHFQTTFETVTFATKDDDDDDYNDEDDHCSAD